MRRLRQAPTVRRRARIGGIRTRGDLAGRAERVDPVAPALTALREFGVLPRLQRR